MSNMIFNEAFLGREWLMFTRPVIYAWFREYECLYVGLSKHGISRVFSRLHHVVGIQDVVRPLDTIRLFFPPVKDDNELHAVEKLYIRTLNPKYNTVRYLKPGQKQWTGAKSKDEVFDFTVDISEKVDNSKLSIEQMERKLAELQHLRQVLDNNSQ